MEKVITKKQLIDSLFPAAETAEPDIHRYQTISRKEADEESYQPLQPKIDKTKKISRHRARKGPSIISEISQDGFVDTNRTIKPSKIVRKRFQAQIVRKQQEASESEPSQVSEDESSDEESDEEEDAKRERIRARILQHQSKEVASVVTDRLKEESKAEASNGSSSSSSEWETESDESDVKPMIKPKFVPKSKRESIKRQEEIEKMELEREEQRIKRLEERRQEGRQLVVQEIKREKEAAERSEDTTDEEMPDDTDDLNPEEEYKAWEIREMKRVIRDREEREALRKEQEETIRRRNLTEKERQQEDEKLGKNQPAEKAKWKFMQKYYHKGAFYMDEESVDKASSDVRNRDASGATLEDKFDKEMMPKVKQVRNFGKSGRTKYTHLVDQDTSRGAMWSKPDEIRAKYQAKMSGIGDVDIKPSKKRKTG